MARRGVQPVDAQEALRLRSQPGASIALDLIRKAVASGRRTDVRIYRLPDGRVLIELSRNLAVVYDSEARWTALVDRSPEQHFTRPWPERRGNEAYDGNYRISAVKAPPAEVTAKLAATRAGVVRDAIGRDVPAAREWMLVLRIEAHPWTLVIAEDMDESGFDELDELSRAAGVKVFHFSASDTVGSLEYRLVEGGTEVERFSAENDCLESFRSTRGTNAPDPDDFHAFVGDVVVELDLYLPSFSGDYFVRQRPADGTWQVRNPGQVLGVPGGKDITSVPPLETVDYIWRQATPKA